MSLCVSLLAYVCVCERDSLYLSLTHHRHAVLGYSHFYVEMSRIRVGCHQRFYGFDKTLMHCSYQRRLLVVALGGRRGKWGMGKDRGRAIRIPFVYRVLVLHVCVHGKKCRDSTTGNKGDPRFLFFSSFSPWFESERPLQ